MAKKKYFTSRDIDQLIPQLEKIFAHIDGCRQKAEALAASFPAKPAVEPADVETAQRLRSQVDFLMQAVQDNIDYIQSLGGVTKDIESGLVDFPAHVEGEDVWLCWKRGESRVQFWHALDEGFSQRQALRRLEAPPTTFH